MVSQKNSSFFKNLIWAIILIFALLVFVQIALGSITRHAQEVPVPDFHALSIEEAERLASKDCLRLDVRDSVYVDNIGRGTVFSQNPQAGEMVKKGRRILLVVNSTGVKTVAAPSLAGLSLRGARTELIARGFKLGKLEYVPDMATNYVLNQMCGNRRIAPGDQLPLGSTIDLQVGVNPEENVTYVPRLTGFSLTAASEELFDNSLNLAGVVYDSTVVTEQDKMTAVVYSQSPAASEHRPFPRGTRVTLYLTVDSARLCPPSLDSTLLD